MVSNTVDQYEHPTGNVIADFCSRICRCCYTEDHQEQTLGRGTTWSFMRMTRGRFSRESRSLWVCGGQDIGQPIRTMIASLTFPVDHLMARIRRAAGADQAGRPGSAALSVKTYDKGFQPRVGLAWDSSVMARPRFAGAPDATWAERNIEPASLGRQPALGSKSMRVGEGGGYLCSMIALLRSLDTINSGLKNAGCGIVRLRCSMLLVMTSVRRRAGSGT